MRITAPLGSIRAFGWLGKYQYARRGVVSNPYPIGFFLHQYGIRWRKASWFDPVARWTTKDWTWSGDKSILNYYSLAQFYSPIGWLYQRRRTWHGVINIIERPYIPTNPRTVDQQANRAVFAAAVLDWQISPAGEKEYWNKQAAGKPYSGYNKFISNYMKQNPA